jgi:HK97 gp10 family phage protein
MMPSIHVTVKGFDELAERLQGLGPEIAAEAREEVQMSALEIESRAKELSPVDTGRLRSSIRTEVGAAPEEISATVFTDVDYAIFVELGTSRAEAQPFLVPAAEEVAPQMIRRLEGIVERAVQG